MHRMVKQPLITKGLNVRMSKVHRQVHFLDRERHQCAYPMWGDRLIPVEQKMVCGRAVKHSPYCETHARKCMPGEFQDKREKGRAA